ncbi:RICIN domain-containing protein [Persicobacter diffluens]|uniref:Ricin B lectin domain-containing protein n=1 Tax=Persicobacter diffluens TaxID=981 RepID=A0AAN4W2Y3_9BACT|nr:hypothetical protein PEDI_46990 [Persicobacter diffluens]
MKNLFLQSGLLLLFICLPVSLSAQVIKCNDFLDNVGVSGANNWTDFDAQNVDVPYFYQKASELGARFFRTGKWLGYDPAPYGLKVSFVSGYSGTFRNTSNLASNLNLARNYGSSLMVIEGPNEPNPNTESTEIFEWQKVLYPAVKNDTDFNGVLVAGPSLAHSYGYTKLDNLTNYSDLGNTHPYTWEISELHPRLDEWLDRCDLIHNGQVKMATEMGTHNDLSTGGVSPEADAIYIARSYLYLYKMGFRYIANFRFADENSTHEGGKHWGMIDWNLNETPQYKSLKNLIALMQDNSSNFSTRDLDYSISGAGLDVVEEMVFQHSDGRYFIVLWQAVDSFNDATGQLTNPPSKGATITFNQPIKKIRTFKPTNPSTLANGLNPLKTYDNEQSVSLQVNDHILVVEVTPSGFLLEEGTYALKNIDSQRYLSMPSGSAGQAVTLGNMNSNNTDHQWQFTKSEEDGYYFIKNQQRNLWIRPDNKSATLGEKVESHNGTGDGTKWKLIPLSGHSDRFLLESKVGAGVRMKNEDCLKTSGTRIVTHNGTGNCVQWEISSLGNARRMAASESGSVIYPNPVKDGVIYFSGEGDQHYRLLDSTGRLILSGEGTQINVEGVSAGVYLVQLDAGTYKVIIE